MQRFPEIWRGEFEGAVHRIRRIRTDLAFVERLSPSDGGLECWLDVDDSLATTEIYQKAFLELHARLEGLEK